MLLQPPVIATQQLIDQLHASPKEFIYTLIAVTSPLDVVVAHKMY